MHTCMGSKSSQLLVARPTVPRGTLSGMTGQAPPHFVCGSTRRIPHRLHSTMAVDALQPRSEMPLVGEVDMIREPLQSCPCDRPLLIPMCSEVIHRCRSCSHRLMTRHADVYAWHAGHGGFLCMTMTKEAIGLQSSGMELMAKIDGLQILPSEICSAGGVQCSTNRCDHCRQQD
jgi:hypothetical protein